MTFGFLELNKHITYQYCSLMQDYLFTTNDTQIKKEQHNFVFLRIILIEYIFFA